MANKAIEMLKNTLVHNFVDHKFVYQEKKAYICSSKTYSIRLL